MGALVKAYVVVGVRLSDVFRTEVVKEKARKYDPDTGEPRTVEVARRRFYLFEREIEEPQETDPENWGLLAGLSHYQRSPCWGSPADNPWDRLDPDSVVGVPVAETDNLACCGEVLPIPPDAGQAAAQKAAAALLGAMRKVGSAAGTFPDIRMFLVGYAGC